MLRSQAIVFEEIATMDFPFEGIPTIPPRKDMDHFAFYCDGCRYRIKGNIDECAIDLKKRLWDGGLGRGNDMTTGRRKRIAKWEDIVLIYAGQQFADDIPLREFHVPPGCKVMLAVDKRILEQDKPDPDSSYWL